MRSSASNGAKDKTIFHMHSCNLVDIKIVIDSKRIASDTTAQILRLRSHSHDRMIVHSYG